jgi:HEAT repeat protein
MSDQMQVLHLASPEAKDRLHAAEALGEIGPAAAGAAPGLAEALRADTDAKVRVAAAEALGWIGTAAPAAMPVLLAALRDPGSGEQWNGECR